MPSPSGRAFFFCITDEARLTFSHSRCILCTGKNIFAQASAGEKPKKGSEHFPMNGIDLKNDLETDWRTMPPDERRRALFNKQKDLLDTFLSHGAIDRRQYVKSLTCMAEKMGMTLDKEDLR